jgi:hypothetical protein
VRAFARLPQKLGFAIEYDNATILRYQEPDFVTVDRTGLTT